MLGIARNQHVTCRHARDPPSRHLQFPRCVAIVACLSFPSGCACVWPCSSFSAAAPAAPAGRAWPWPALTSKADAGEIAGAAKLAPAAAADASAAGAGAAAATAANLAAAVGAASSAGSAVPLSPHYVATT